MNPKDWLKSHVGLPISEQQVRDVERQLDCNLPEEYRLFIAHYNGGYLHENYLPVSVNNVTHWLANISIIPLVASTENGGVDVLFCQENCKDALPDHCIIIANPAGGSAIVVMYVSGSRSGQVWVKSSDCDPNDCESGMYYCASSFTEMMNLLQSQSPPDEAPFVD